MSTMVDNQSSACFTLTFLYMRIISFRYFSNYYKFNYVLTVTRTIKDLHESYATSLGQGQLFVNSYL